MCRCSRAPREMRAKNDVRQASKRHAPHVETRRVLTIFRRHATATCRRRTPSVWAQVEPSHLCLGCFKVHTALRHCSPGAMVVGIPWAGIRKICWRGTLVSSGTTFIVYKGEAVPATRRIASGGLEAILRQPSSLVLQECTPVLESEYISLPKRTRLVTANGYRRGWATVLACLVWTCRTRNARQSDVAVQELSLIHI